MPTVVCNKVDCLQDEVDYLIRDEVVEVDPNPTRFDTLATPGDFAFELVRTLEINAEEPVPVRAGT